MSDTGPVIDPLTILLSRAARGVLLPEEGDQLRVLVVGLVARVAALEKQATEHDQQPTPTA